MKHRSVDRDILVVIILTIIALILGLVTPANWVPIRILTLPLVFVLPGYALTSAIFPRQAQGIVERFVFSMGFSLAIVILGGLLLNLLPFGLRTTSWALFLGVITLGACAVAYIRQRERIRAVSTWPGIRGIGFTFRQWLLLGLAVLIVSGAVVFSIIGAERQPRPGFTQLWMLPASGTANAKNVIRLGVSNMEAQPMEYRLIVNMDGKVVKVWSSIDLSSNQNWEATLMLPQTGQHTNTSEVEALLYRLDAPTTLYRHVEVWLNT